MGDDEIWELYTWIINVNTITNTLPKTIIKTAKGKRKQVRTKRLDLELACFY